MSEKNLRLFEFVPNPECPETDRISVRDDASQKLLGHEPLVLEEDGPQQQTQTGPEYGQQDAGRASSSANSPSGASLSGQPYAEIVPSYPAFVLETEQGRRLFAQGHVRLLQETIDHQGFLLCIADFCSVNGVGVLHLQGAVKYADLLARKKLEEQGEMSAADLLLVHDVRRGQGREFSVLYQVAPRQQVRAVEQRCRLHAGGMQYVDSLGFLRGVLLGEVRPRPGGARALALKLPGAFLLLVADGPRCHLARRYPFLQNSPGSLSGCLAAMRRDVDATSAKNSVHTIRLTELAATAEEHEQLIASAAEHTGLEVLQPCVLQQSDGGVCLSALPGLVKRFPLSHVRGPAAERLLRPLERSEKWVWVMLCAGILLCWGLIWHGQQQIRELQQQSVQLRQELHLAAAPPRIAPSAAPEDFARLSALAEMLTRVRAFPSLAAVWNRIGAAKPDALSMGNLTIDYAQAGVRVTLEARVYAGLQDSQQLTLDFIQGLKMGGALVGKHELRLDGSGEQYLSLNLEYPGRNAFFESDSGSSKSPDSPGSTGRSG